jgi:eukaryotic-like serine/threonine-protein kinase
MSLNVGDRIGDYEVLGVLGVGGMGEVYRVRNTITNRVEAVKVVLPNMMENSDLAERFEREIRLHASLDHPNIAHISTAFRDGDRLIMVMELVEGETLAARLAAGRMPLADGLGCIDQILSALDHVHQRTLVHRDIKPANIMLTPDFRMKLMDFGVAKGESGLALTKVGFTVGSLHYMSPEQIQAAAVDARSDLYSLGIVMYETLAGQRPFEGENESAVMTAHLKEIPPAPTELDPNIPSPLSDIVLMAIAKEPGKRFQTARAMQNALRGVSKGLGLTIVTAASAPTPAAPAPAPSTPAPSAPAASTPPPPAPAASIPPPPPPELGAPATAGKPKSGMRLGYMLIGALAAVLVLVVGITQIPKWRSAQAEPETEQVAGEVPVATPDSAPDEELAQPAPEPDSETAVQPSVESAATSAGEVTTQAEEQIPPVRPASAPPARPAASAPLARPTPAPARRAEEAEMPPIEQTTGFLDAQKAAREQREAEAARFAALDELQERQILMATRVSAARSALDKLEREQSSMGLSLRGDMAGARQLMETRMVQAEAAIEAGNIEAAKQYLDQAESQLSKLERFLNI